MDAVGVIAGEGVYLCVFTIFELFLIFFSLIMKTIEGFKLRKLGNEYILVGESMEPPLSFGKKQSNSPLLMAHFLPPICANLSVPNTTLIPHKP